MNKEAQWVKGILKGETESWAGYKSLDNVLLNNSCCTYSSSCLFLQTDRQPRIIDGMVKVLNYIFIFNCILKFILGMRLTSAEKTEKDSGKKKK